MRDQGVPEFSRVHSQRAGGRGGAEQGSPGVLWLLRLAFVRPRSLDAYALAPAVSGVAGKGRDHEGARCEPHRRQPSNGSELLQATRYAIVRANVWLGLDVEARRGAAPLHLARRE